MATRDPGPYIRTTYYILYNSISYLSEVDERELWGQQYSPKYIYIFTPHTIEKIYERYIHASILLQHLATAPLVTRQLHELVRDICQPPGTFVSSASSTTRRNHTLSPFQDSPASTPNISQPRSWIHADILIQGLIASPLDMPHRGGGPPPPHID